MEYILQRGFSDNICLIILSCFILLGAQFVGLELYVKLREFLEKHLKKLLEVSDSL